MNACHGNPGGTRCVRCLRGRNAGRPLRLPAPQHRQQSSQVIPAESLTNTQKETYKQTASLQEAAVFSQHGCRRWHSVLPGAAALLMCAAERGGACGGTAVGSQHHPECPARDPRVFSLIPT